MTLQHSDATGVAGEHTLKRSLPMSWNCISLPLNVIVSFTLSPCAGRHLTSSEGSNAAL